MDRRCRQLLTTVILMLAMAVSMTAAVFASDDNSLASLGIKTQGVTVSPEFRYDIWEYSVEVPAGTKTLEMEPHTTNPSATVNSVTGTTLSDDGTGRVVITVTSESGNAIEYILNVTTARGNVDPAEAIAANEGTDAVATIESEVVLQSEVETEDPRYVKVDRNSLEDAEKTIEKLQATITEQRNHISMMTYVLYALIAVSIIFLFIVISQLLRRRDMAQELAIYRQNDPYHGDEYVSDDGWGEWGEDDVDRSNRKKKKKQAPDDDDWDDEPVNASSSWVDERVGTPVQPPRPVKKPSQTGDAGKSKRGKNSQVRSGQAVKSRQTNAGQAYHGSGISRQTGSGQPRQNTGALRQGSSAPRQGGAAAHQGSAQYRTGSGAPRQNAGRQGTQASRGGNYNETRRYQAVQPVHADEVPRDVTKDLTRMNKAEAKAMKKAAAAEAKREQEARRAAKAREAEARRQAQEAERLEKEQEAARAAQEEALRQAAAQRAEQESESGARASENGSGNDKNVKINMIDL